MNLDQIEARAVEIAAELKTLDSFDDWTAKQRARYDELTSEMRDLDQRKLIYQLAQDPANIEAEGPAPQRAFRDQGLRTIDTAHRSGLLAEHAAEKAERLITTGTARDRSVASRWAVAAGDPSYLSAFQKLIADPTRGHLLWTTREQDAYRAVEEFRAMSLTDAAGGYMVPMVLDPTIILTSDGSINPIRRISRVVQTVTDQWQGVTSAGVTGSWDGEAVEVSDDAPTLAGPSIPIYKYQAFVPFSIEVGQDGASFTSEVSAILADAADVAQAAAFTTGSGTNQPTGIITALTGTTSVVASATADTFAIGDVYALQAALPPRFSPRSQWLANIAIHNKMRQFEGGTSREFPEINNGRLLGKPLSEASDMDGTITATADNYVLLLGDFRHYVIADRIGSTIELVPHLFGTNHRPTGQRGFYMYLRVGADSVADGAFRLLNVT